MVFIIPVAIYAHNPKLEKLIVKYKNNPSFDYSHATSNMEIDMSWTSDFSEMLRNTKNIHVLKYTNEKSNDELRNFKISINKILRKGDYKELMDIATDGVFKILVRYNNNNDPSEVIILNSCENDIMLLWATE